MVASEATKTELSDAMDTMLEEVRWFHSLLHWWGHGEAAELQQMNAVF